MFGEGNKKMGFYPTQDPVLELFKQIIHTKNLRQHYNIYDNCCGDGRVLKFIKDHIEDTSDGMAKTYGIELDQARAKLAAQNTTKVLNASYEDKCYEEPFAGFGFCNPPYNHDEDKFIRDMFDMMVVGAPFIVIIQEQRLDNYRVKHSISVNATKVRILQYPEESKDDFNQILIVGEKAQPEGYSHAASSSIHPSAIEPLVPDVLKTIKLRPRKTYKPPAFETIHLDEGVLSELSNPARLNHHFNNLQDVAYDSNLRPCITPKPSELILLMTSGLFSTEMKINGEPVLINGHIEQKRSRRESMEEDKTVTTLRYSPQPKIHGLTQSGKTFTL